MTIKRRYITEATITCDSCGKTAETAGEEYYPASWFKVLTWEENKDACTSECAHRLFDRSLVEQPERLKL